MFRARLVSGGNSCRKKEKVQPFPSAEGKGKKSTFTTIRGLHPGGEGKEKSLTFFPFPTERGKRKEKRKRKRSGRPVLLLPSVCDIFRRQREKEKETRIPTCCPLMRRLPYGERRGGEGGEKLGRIGALLPWLLNGAEEKGGDRENKCGHGFFWGKKEGKERGSE